jgi:hypothetical protein
MTIPKRHQPRRATAILLAGVVTVAVLARPSAAEPLRQPATPSQSIPAPVATPDPTIAALQNAVATQQVQIDRLTRGIEDVKKDQEDALRDVRWYLDRRLIIAAAVLAVLAFLGIKEWAGLEGKIRARMNSALDKELYQLDPTMLTIHLRRDRGLEREYRRLEMSGLKNLKWYDDFGKACLKGITIVPITNEADETEFRTFLSTFAPDPRRAAFILYAVQPYRVTQSTIDAYDNVALAQTPTTLAGAVLVAGRGLSLEPPATPQP